MTRLLWVLWKKSSPGSIQGIRSRHSNSHITLRRKYDDGRPYGWNPDNLVGMCVESCNGTEMIWALSRQASRLQQVSYRFSRNRIRLGKDT